MNVRYLTQCLAQGKHSINVSHKNDDMMMMIFTVLIYKIEITLLVISQGYVSICYYIECENAFQKVQDL